MILLAPTVLGNFASSGTSTSHNITFTASTPGKTIFIFYQADAVLSVGGNWVKVQAGVDNTDIGILRLDPSNHTVAQTSVTVTLASAYSVTASVFEDDIGGSLTVSPAAFDSNYSTTSYDTGAVTIDADVALAFFGGYVFNFGSIFDYTTSYDNGFSEVANSDTTTGAVSALRNWVAQALDVTLTAQAVTTTTQSTAGLTQASGFVVSYDYGPTTLGEITFEGGSDGAALADEGNFIATGTQEYDSSQKYGGSLSGLFGSSAGTMSYDFGVSGASQFRCRMYVRRGFSSMSGHPMIARIEDGSSSYVGDFQIRNTSGGRYRNRWGYNSYFEEHSVDVPQNVWQRVDLLYRGPDVADEGWTALVYSTADDTVVEATLDVPSFNDTVRYLRLGVISNPQGDVWLDDIILTDSLDDPGPAVGGGPSSTELIKIGDDTVSSIHIGEDAVDRVYQGDILVFGSQP